MVRILIIGSSGLGLSVTKGVCNNAHLASIVAVYPWSRHAKGIAYKSNPYERAFIQFLKQKKLHIRSTKSVNHPEFLQDIDTLKPDLILVAGWDEILKPPVIDHPQLRIINCHPSLLPHHRGPNPYRACILQQEATTGVTFHELDAGIDTGPILLQEAIDILPEDTAHSLRGRLHTQAEVMVSQLLTGLQNNTLTPIPQPTDEGSYDPHVSDNDTCIVWTDPPEDIALRFRSLYDTNYMLTLLNNTVFGFLFGTLVPYPQDVPHHEPGHVIKRTTEGLWVASSDPKQAFLLEQPKCFCIHQQMLPSWISPILCWLLLRPGKQFTPNPLAAASGTTEAST